MKFWGKYKAMNVLTDHEMYKAKERALPNQHENGNILR